MRENNEGEYSEIGGRLYPGTEDEMAVQENVFTRRGVDRILRYAFELARSARKRHLTSATKSNGIIHTMPFWDERFAAMADDYPEVRTDQYHIDILTAHFVLHPDWFDVVVGSQPVRRHPVRPGAGGDRHHRHRAVGQHQSGARVSLDVRAGARLGAGHRRPGHRQSDRPDLVGRHDAGASRPCEAAAAIVEAIETVLAEGPRTPDMGGKATTGNLAGPSLRYCDHAGGVA